MKKTKAIDRRENKLSQKLRIKNNLLGHIYEISSLLTRSPNLAEVLNGITDRAIRAQFRSYYLMLLNSDKTKLECKCIKGFTPQGERRTWDKPLIFNKHDCYETKVVRSGTPRFIPDTESASDVTPIDKVINHTRRNSCFMSR